MGNRSAIYALALKLEAHGEELAAENRALRAALEMAINSVDCASIDINPQSATYMEELPWYKAAHAVLAMLSE